MQKHRWKDLSKTQQQQILQRPVNTDSAHYRIKTQAIISKVQQQLDQALIDLAQQYDGAVLVNLAVSAAEFSQAHQQIDAHALAAIKFAYQQIHAYHAAYMPVAKSITTASGVYCERQVRPIPRVGLYVPGGSAPLVSTALMLGVPSRLANCPIRVLCTPANKEGKIDPHLLVAADLCGIEQVYKVGGAQAIAAMAYGTETIPKVDKIFGPGNAWVTQAKMLVSQDPLGAAIDMPAGPSELLIIADMDANPEFVAADLLSQAEHGPDSQVGLIALSEKFCDAVYQALLVQLATLPRRLIAEKSLFCGHMIVVDTIDEAIEISNYYAPEHLILQVVDAEKYTPQIQNAAAVFLGAWSPETVGDYVTGSNHVLPTNGYARNHSGLSVVDFMKFISLQTLTPKGLQHIGPYAAKLAQMEGLIAHKQAVDLRLQKQTTQDDFPAQTDNILALIRADLREFSAYSSARDEAKQGRIFLNANESPWDHRPIDEISLNRYPEKQPAAVLQALANLYKLTAEQIALFRGSDEAIDLLIRLFCTAGEDSIMICPPTFGMYAIYAQLQNAQVIEVPLRKQADFQLDVPRMLQESTPKLKLIFICSPNNPTGNLIKTEDILKLCQAFSGKSIIVVDEAYIDYASAATLITHIKNYANLAILRTFSKAYGLAGARCGVLLASAELIYWIGKIMSPYPLSALTIQAVGQTLLSSQLKKIQQQIVCIQQEREHLFKQLLAFPWVKKIWHSEANYLFLEVDDAQKVMQVCQSQGVVLRSFHAKAGLENCIRISIGLPEENQHLIHVLKGIAV